MLWCYFWSTHNILPLEDIYKANGYLKVFCNVLAHTDVHLLYEWQYLNLLYADDTFLFLYSLYLMLLR